MNLHEYQAKALFQQQGIPVPEGRVVASVQEARAQAEALAGQRWAVKAQVHAGGRGKGGGVVLAERLDDVTREAERILSQPLVTPQTGPDGLPVHHLLIESPVAIARELYLGMLVDRAAGRILVMTSPAGGMSIEEVAAATPEQIFSLYLDPVWGLMPYQGRQLAFSLGLSGSQIKAFGHLLQQLSGLFLRYDLSLAEINPLVVTESGQLLALDAKLVVDDNALGRQPEISALRDLSQEDAREAQAAEHQLNYISLEGNIGCMVNGAGLAMATMDLVKLHGGEPANFLDVGGGTTAARVAEAFKLILSDDKVRAVLVNIFGGIVRCDLIAEGIIQAVKEVGIQIPVVVRLEGTNAEQGLTMLSQSGLALETAADLTTAAQQVVAAAQGGAA